MLLVGCIALHCSVKVNIVINIVRLFILTIIFHFLIPKHVSRHEISPQKKRKKENNSKIFLGKVYSNFAAPVAFAELGSSLHSDRCVPAPAPAALQRRRAQAGPWWDAAPGWLPAGSVSWAGRGRDPHFHPAGMVTNASALWRPLNVSNSRTCAEAMLCASLKTELISHNRTAHALDI